MNRQVRLHYATQDWRKHTSSALLEDRFPSVEAAKNALPEGCAFAAIFTEDRTYFYSPRFSWDEAPRS